METKPIKSMIVHEVGTRADGFACFTRRKEIRFDNSQTIKKGVKALKNGRWAEIRGVEDYDSSGIKPHKLLDIIIEPGRNLYVIHLNAKTIKVPVKEGCQPQVTEQSLYFVRDNPISQIASEGTCVENAFCKFKTYDHGQIGARWASFIIDTADFETTNCKEQEDDDQEAGQAPAETMGQVSEKKYHIPFFYNFRDHNGCPPWIYPTPKNSFHGGAHPPIGSSGVGGP